VTFVWDENGQWQSKILLDPHSVPVFSGKLYQLKKDGLQYPNHRLVFLWPGTARSFEESARARESLYPRLFRFRCYFQNPKWFQIKDLKKTSPNSCGTFFFLNTG
jgi:hypothetical protein